MKVTRLDLTGLVLIELDIREDARGFFVERFHAGRFRDHGLPGAFAQDNHSRSAQGVLRGLHYRHSPPLGKLVGVVHGCVWDVVVDIRPTSPTFGQHFGAEMSDVNGRMLWVLAGFAHGMCVMGDEPADFSCKTDALYHAAEEGGIFWADADLAIRWPVSNPLVSERDAKLPSFAEHSAHPVDWHIGREKALVHRGR